MPINRVLPLLPLIALGLGACQKPAETPPAATDTAATTTTTNSVVREDVSAPAEPAPAAPVQAAIQTQPGPAGTQVALNKVAVTGDILTVQLTYTGGDKSEWQHPRIDQISVIDDATAQRIGVLKDGEGAFLASPINSGPQNELGFRVGEGAKIVWAKFPAPPATSKTVSINIPDVVPFDGVPVTR